MSRSVLSHRSGTRFRLPGGTECCHVCQGSRENVERSIMISIKHQATTRTDMGTSAKTFLYPFATAGTILRGKTGRDGHNRHARYLPIVAEPLKELTPCHVTNALGEVMIPDEVGDLQVLKSNHVARHDKRPCRLHGEVPTLPADLEIALGESLDRFLAVGAALLLAVLAPMEPLQFLFGFAQKAGVLYLLPFGISVEGFQPDINAGLLPGRLAVYLSPRFHGKLDIIAIGSLQETDALDLRQGKRGNAARFFAIGGGSHQAECPDVGAIGKGQTLPIWLQTPAAYLVLGRAVIVLKTGIALLAGFVLAAILVEATDSRPGAICRCLPRIGVQLGGKGEVFGKLRAEALLLNPADVLPIHPQAQRLVANELDGADGFLNRGALGLIHAQFVFNTQHNSALLSWQPSCIYSFCPVENQKGGCGGSPASSDRGGSRAVFCEARSVCGRERWKEPQRDHVKMRW